MKTRVSLANFVRQFFVASIATLVLGGCGGGGGAGPSGGTTGGTPTPTVTYSIGGNVAGLSAGQSLVLQDNGGDNLTVGGNGGFTFATKLASGALYNVTVARQPTNGQVCSVTAGSGTVASANVSTVQVVCTSTVGGYLVGLAAGQSVVLQNNGSDNLTVSANGTFTFATPVTSYNVTVSTQPANGQVCAVAYNNTIASSSSGIGTVTGGPVDTVRVSCASVFTFAGSRVSGIGDAADSKDAVFASPSGMTKDAAGNIYVADGRIVRMITTAGAVRTLAGSATAGYVDGAGAAARFGGMRGLAADSAGNVYVADAINNMIRKISPAGVVTTFAGQVVAGYADGTGMAAQFNRPLGVAVDSNGNVYVADTGNNVIRLVTPGGVVSTFAGSLTAGKADGTGLAAQFCSPSDLAMDAANNLYVTDVCNSSVRKITPSAVVTTLAGAAGYPGYLDATGTAARFDGLNGITVDAAGNVYVSDFSNKLVRQISPTGVVSTLAGWMYNTTANASADGPITTGSFWFPYGVLADSAGNIYVSDGRAYAIRKISASPYRYTVNGHVMGLGAGKTLVLQNNLSDNLAINANGFFTFSASLATSQTYSVSVQSQPTGQTCTVSNGVGAFVSGEMGDVLNVNVNCALVSTFAGSGVAGLANSTTALGAAFNSPSGVAFDAAGNLYVADVSNHVIRKITPAGVVSTLAGAGVAGYVEGAGAAAKFSFSGPTGLAVDAAGNVYVGDTRNLVIRKITSAGVVSTLAGKGPGWIGFADGTGTAAMFLDPRGVALDALGNLYVADSSNNSIRKVTTSGGVVTTLAGGGGWTNTGNTDGIGTAARFTNPTYVAVDGAGTVYVADTGNGRVRKITPSGVVSTLAGGGGAPLSGGYRDSSGTGAAFSYLLGIAVDATGNVYVADGSVRMINPTGTVVTLAGTTPVPTSGYADGNGATALFNFTNNCSNPTQSGPGLAVDASGSVFVGDNCNNRIRKIVMQ